MLDVLDRIEKILRLEEGKGFTDSAVFGGLSKFFIKLALDAGRGAGDPQTVQNFRKFSEAFSDYAVLPPEQRQELVGLAQNWLASARYGKPLTPTPVKTTSNLKQPQQTTTSAARNTNSSKAGSISPKKEPRAKPSGDIVNLDSPVRYTKGINSQTALKLTKLGVETIRDLLFLYPRRYMDRSSVQKIAHISVGEEATIVATVWQATARVIGRDRSSTEAVVGDDTGNIRIIWFNQPYLARQFAPNTTVILSGKVSIFQGNKVFVSPEYEFLESEDLIHTGRLVPIYPLTQGLSMRTLRRVIKGAVDRYAAFLLDPLPEEVKDGADIINLDEAIRQIHFPETWEAADVARTRLAFDEFFLVQLAALTRRQSWQEEQLGTALKIDRQQIDAFMGLLPYQLTGAQKRTIEEILGDLEKPKPMSRLLQGDVGSGKTVVAAITLLAAITNGFQAVIMAPTELLAEQHYRNLGQMFSETLVSEGHKNDDGGPGICLLTGSLRKSEKLKIHASIAEGSVNIIVGTHAVIQDGVEFKNLGVAVVDEQHRFGVRQRSVLRQKGYNPHMLVMSATPIPRTLALTLYGDLDLSVIDEMPPGRQRITTKYVAPTQRKRAYEFIRQQINEGRQAFIICPLIEESDKIEAKAAVAEYERLSHDVFPNLNLGLLHGKMKPSEKDDIMRSFRNCEMDILVSTSVIEVGIDIPNASVMVIEGADRFGLSQLHQFRGRVGRGPHKSYCLLLSDSESREARERLSIMERTENGFDLAEQDLRIRGPGEFFGTRQSGLPELKIATLSDVSILETARKEAIKLFKRDPYLSRPEHSEIKLQVSRLFNVGGDLS